jgi:transposase
MALRLRELTAAEQAAIEKLARSRCASARLVERTRMVWRASQGQRVPAIAQELHLTQVPVRPWLKRFNAHGLEGLQAQPRSGRPMTYTPDQVAEGIAAALTNPQDVGLPFASWTLDRVQAYLNEHKGIAIKRSRIDELLVAEGLRWRTQEPWFGERVDPAFAKKRGGLNTLTRTRLRRVS